jgi:anti-sigma B factor antagonist
VTEGDVVRVRDRRGPLAVAAISGTMEYETEEVLRTALTELVAQGVRHMILDMTDVDFFDSSGIRVLLGLWRRVQDVDGTLSLAAMPERVRETLTRLGIDQVLPIYATVGEALTARQTNE